MSSRDAARPGERGAVAFFARNPVAANVLMALVVVAGLVTLPAVRVEIFPEFSADIVTVSVPYPGATPVEVEEGICRRIEEELSGLDGVDQVTSSAAEGMGTVRVEVRAGEDVRAVLSDVKVRVDAIDSFPELAEEPVVEEFVPRNQVINVAVSGPLEERSLRGLAERVRDDLLARPGITQVTMAAARPYEVSIEVSEEALRRHGLTYDELAAALRARSLDLPGGALRTRGGEVLLRTRGQGYVGEDFERMPVLTREDGTRLVLSEVARVVDGFEETDQSARFDGQPAIVLQVFRVGDQNAIDVADEVKAYVAEARRRMPEGVLLTTWRDDVRYLEGRIETLLRNGWQGLLLVFVVLALFLRLGLAFWVTLGIPISFLGALALFPTLGMSINVLSLFAFIVVLGIVVDDAIVVGENVYQRIQRGEEGTHAAVRGAREVAVPVVFAVLTSIVAFAPMAVLSGFTGKIWRVIPLTVIPTLVMSLVESLWILPAHLEHLRVARHPRGLLRAWEGVQERFGGALEALVTRVYEPFCRRALHARYLTLAVFCGVALLTAGYVAGGGLPFRFFPKLPADDVSAQLTMPLGTPAAVTAEALERIEAAALELAVELESEGQGEIVQHLLASVGEQPFRTASSQNGGNIKQTFTGSHLGEVHVALVPSEDRTGDITPEEIVRRWREKVGPVPGAAELAYTSELVSAGKAVDVQLSGPDLEALRSTAAELRELLSGYPGVYDVSDSFREGKREVVLAVRSEAEAAGLTQADLARQVRQAFYGEEVQRVLRGRDEVKVMLRLPAEERRSLEALERLRIRLADGTQVPLTTVATLSHGLGESTIERTDRRRTVHVTAEVDPALGSSGDVLADLAERVLPGLVAARPGMTWSFEGEQREQADTLRGLVSGLIVALLVIYGLMAIPFRSYFQPFLVMTAIPFGMVGAFLGHILVGMPMNVLSLCGLLALAGVVVNDNLVLIDFVNREVRAGARLVDAISGAGARRFRPILLTSLTTFVGLTPLMLETSVQARFLIPMAISLAFGVLFSTFTTLLLTPALYLIGQDLAGLAARVLGRTPPARAAVETSR